MNLRPEDDIVAAPDAYWSVVDGSLLLFSATDRRLHVLNETAAMVWALTDREIRVGDVIDRMASTYKSDPRDVEPDVLAMLNRFIVDRVCVLVVDGAPTDEGAERSSDGPSSYEFSVTNNTIGPMRVLGSTVYIDVEDADLAAELRRVLDPLGDSGDQSVELDGGRGVLGYSITHSGGDTFEIARNGEYIASVGSRANCLRTILSSLNSAPLGAIDDALVLHAAAAEIDGQVIAFAGVSNAGKSTLVTQLVERGHGYLTDEALIVELETFIAHPFTKSICVDPGAQPVLKHLQPDRRPDVSGVVWDVDPRSVGPGRLSDGGPVRAFVFPIYRPRTDSTVRRLEPIECMHRLLRNTFDFSSLGQPGFAALVRMATELPAWELAHGGEGHLELVEDLVGSLALVSP